MTTTSYQPDEKPGLVTAITVMTLISGIVNVFWGLIASVTVLATIVGIICVPFAILPTVLGIFEIIYAAKLLSNPPQPVQPSTSIAILEIVCILAGNIFSMIVGILSLVFYNDLVVKEYFARLNGTPTPEAPIAPPPPVSLPVQPPAPVEPPAPQPEENPARPKRPRKVAGK